MPEAKRIPDPNRPGGEIDVRVLVGTARIQAAREHLEHARSHLEAAIADLSSVMLVDREVRRIRAFVHGLKSSFYVLQMVAERFPRGEHRKLDRDPDARELAMVRRTGAASHFGCGDHK